MPGSRVRVPPLLYVAQRLSALREGCVSSLEGAVEGKEVILLLGAANRIRSLPLPSHSSSTARHMPCDGVHALTARPESVAPTTVNVGQSSRTSAQQFDHGGDGRILVA